MSGTFRRLPRRCHSRAVADGDGNSAAGDPGCNFLQVPAHRLAVGGRQDDGRSRAARGTYRAGNISGIMAVVAYHQRPRAGSRPYGGLPALLSDPVDRLFSAQPSWNYIPTGLVPALRPGASFKRSGKYFLKRFRPQGPFSGARASAAGASGRVRAARFPSCSRAPRPRSGAPPRRAAPTRDLVLRRVVPLGCQGLQLGALGPGQARHAAWTGPSPQTVQPLVVAAADPVAQRLAVHAIGHRGIGPGPPIQRHRQQAAHLRAVAGPGGKRAEAPARIVCPGDLDRGAHLSLRSANRLCVPTQRTGKSGAWDPPRESAETRIGIRP